MSIKYPSEAVEYFFIDVVEVLIANLSCMSLFQDSLESSLVVHEDK